MQSNAATVQAYIASLPADRRAAIEAVRKVILKNLDKDYVEHMSYGMIGYSVPHSVYPPGYHCNPEHALPFAGLASQKNYMSVYLMCTYGNVSHLKWFQEAWAKTGKKLDMGKCCIRFRKVEDLALDVIGEAIRKVPAKKYIAEVEAGLAKHRESKGEATRATSKKSNAGKAAAKKHPVARATKAKQK
ncbi:MAG: DUF1801 domain-containing protein [Phycisphaeraceae bacterium]|nr:DUF1801 domain-containing protein [Phycisphaeraceae bacterium]